MRKSLLIILAIVVVVFTGCVKDIDKYEFAKTTILKGRVLEEAEMEPIPNVIVCVTDGVMNYASSRTIEDGSFEIEVDYNEIGKGFYLLLDGGPETKSKKLELKGVGREMYDYRGIIMSAKWPSFQYGGYTYYVAPDPGNHMEWSAANSYCNNLSLEGMSGWRMPTIDELVQMYAESSLIGGFNEHQSYWSRTQASSTAHWAVDFWTGNLDPFRSDQLLSVRPIKRKN